VTKRFNKVILTNQKCQAEPRELAGRTVFWKVEVLINTIAAIEKACPMGGVEAKPFFSSH
jgi:hypothetical protein